MIKIISKLTDDEIEVSAGDKIEIKCKNNNIIQGEVVCVDGQYETITLDIIDKTYIDIEIKYIEEIKYLDEIKQNPTRSLA